MLDRKTATLTTQFRTNLWRGGSSPALRIALNDPVVVYEILIAEIQNVVEENWDQRRHGYLRHPAYDQCEIKAIQLTFRWFLSDEPRTWDQFEDNLVHQICGLASADYSEIYSECTGYLWTDTCLVVNGHDLDAVFRQAAEEGKHLSVQALARVEVAS